MSIQTTDIQTTDIEAQIYVKNPFIAKSQYSDSWPDVKKIAVDQGTARINERDAKGNTPLHYAVWASLEVDNFTLIRSLLDLGADPNIRNNEGDDPIDYAVCYFTDGYTGGYKRILDTVKLMFIGYKYCEY